MDRGAWWAAIPRVAKSLTRLKMHAEIEIQYSWHLLYSWTLFRCLGDIREEKRLTLWT